MFEVVVQEDRYRGCTTPLQSDDSLQTQLWKVIPS
jgi:hypothetical protein